jgi:putative endonuclease
MSTQYLGQWGEDLAARHLCACGYTVVARNYRHHHAEIDLIVRGYGCLVFVEVRTRKGAILIDPLSSVTKVKQRHIIRAANFYACLHQIDEVLRFDIVGISLVGTSVAIDHVEDAFLFF